MAEGESDIRITYIALTGKLWGVYCEDFGADWPCYNGTELYSWLLGHLIGECFLVLHFHFYFL